MRNKSIFYAVLALEILAVVLASVGILEREAVLIMTGLLVFYFIFSKVEDSLILFIISIPLFIALPVSDSFDTMANWRILLAVLFLCLLFKQGLSVVKFKQYPMEYLVVVFLIIAFLSLFVAFDVVVGIKKILFLVNIFLLYIIVRNVVQNKEMTLKIVKAGAIAGIISLVVGYSQLIYVFLTSLYNFWQWWARNVISVFYGIDLSKLLAKSNTWFSYYEEALPTLRMFSIFPDSHSFALFTIIGLIFFTYLLIKTSDKIFWIPIALSFLALLFSGSRGVWLSAALPFLIIIFLLFSKKIRENVGLPKSHIKMFIGMLIVFALAFPVSSLIMSQSQGGEDGTLAFKRARTLADLEELSIKSRIEIWQKSFKSILKRPLLGVGIGNYPVVLGEDISAAKRGASAHNLYLDITSEMGFLGLVVLLLIFFFILKKSIKQPMFAFFLLWILIYGLFDVVLLNDKVLLLFMVALGVLYSYEK
jgi:hypothetical protein